MTKKELRKPLWTTDDTSTNRSARNEKRLSRIVVALFLCAVMLMMLLLLNFIAVLYPLSPYYKGLSQFDDTNTIGK